MKKISFLTFIFFLGSSIYGQLSFDIDNLITKRFIDSTGRKVVVIKVPGKPPDSFRMPEVDNVNLTSNILSEVPGYDWSFGCSATSAAMMAGYYDRTSFINTYSGPTNNGLAPMDNSIWGSVVINGETRSQCPLSATRMGVDGRNIKGHVDDYWIKYGNTEPDPYITNGWTQHVYDDCTGDYMKTNQSAFGNTDGSTDFYYYTDGSAYSGPGTNNNDGMYGVKLFFESRGYIVVSYYNQYIYGYNGNTLGFTFTQYKQEIDAGRPVIIQVTGHSMLGFGYDSIGNTVYLHDTWDYSTHSMTWGGSYSGLQQWGVGVITLQPVPFIFVTSPNGGEGWLTGSSHTITWNDNIPENVKIELYKGGIFNSTIVASTVSNGSYLWTIPSNQTAGDNYQIKIISTINNNLWDFSNAYFSIADLLGQPCVIIPSITYGGQTYNTLQIGNQCWLRENLNIGTKINGDVNQTDNCIIEKYCFNNLESNCDIYGGLYQWNEMMQYITTEESQGICPFGWHIPSDDEWTTLMTSLGGTSVAGGKMKETGTLHWLTPNTGATNESGFTALPGGWYQNSWKFWNLTSYGYFWTSSMFSSNAQVNDLRYNLAGVTSSNVLKPFGYSVRCIKDTCSTYSNVSLSISATENPFCAGSIVTFSVTVTNGGTNPIYYWKVNDLKVGTNTSTYSYMPSNGDVVKCVMRSNSTCVQGNPATSNLVTMNVSSNLPVSISISASANPVNAGTLVLYSAMPTNGGNGPSYQWKVNGLNVGTNSPTYSYIPLNVDTITCILTSNLTLICNNPATSNQIIMAVINPCSEITTVTYGGQIYNTIQIGNQCWLRENLNIGTKINGNQNQTNNGIVEKYCFNNLESNCNIYGGLYQWNEMMQYVTTPIAQGICPSGWHISSYNEWSTLMTFLGGTGVAGGKMKEAGTAHWLTPNTGATNESGFTALPGGWRSDSYNFWDLNCYAYFWTTSLYIGTGQTKDLRYNLASVTASHKPLIYGYSVRCVKDIEIPTNTSVTGTVAGTTCYNAIQTISVAGNGTTFTVQNGGSVTMIAGQNILYLPGTSVDSGGYILGYIAPSGPWCSTPSLPAAVNSEVKDSLSIESSSFKIYPNPTSGNFILELNGDFTSSIANVEVFGMQGEKILTAVLTGERKREFSLSDRPAGIYFIRVISGSKAASAKIIKQ